MELILSFIEDPDIKELIEEYQVCLRKEVIKDFNIFTLISDIYYRENYHSDILKAFLEYKDVRSNKYVLLEAFINMIGASRKNVCLTDYKSPKIEREHHNIDILIKDGTSKHCIIIENKFNNAQDMVRQLPKYYDAMTNDGFTVDAVVYLTKYSNIFPDKLGWDDDDDKKIMPILVSLPIYRGKNEVYLLKWIDNTIGLVSDVDVMSVLRQYRQLLRNLEYEMKQLNLIIQLIKKMDSTGNIKIQDIISLRDILYRWPEAMALELR